MKCRMCGVNSCRDNAIFCKACRQRSGYSGGSFRVVRRAQCEWTYPDGAEFSVIDLALSLAAGVMDDGMILKDQGGRLYRVFGEGKRLRTV